MLGLLRAEQHVENLKKCTFKNGRMRTLASSEGRMRKLASSEGRMRKPTSWGGCANLLPGADGTANPGDREL